MSPWSARALAVAAPLSVWAAVTESGLIRHRAVAGPVDTARALAAGLGADLPLDVGATLLRVVGGVALGLLVGLPVGLLAGSAAGRGRAIEPALDFLRAIPPLLVFPVLLMAFGYDERARVGVVAFAAALVVAMYVAAGARRGRPERARALRAMGATRAQALRWLHLYEVLPGCLTGLRHAFATGLVVAVVTEMLVGAPRGLGSRAVDAQIAYDAPALYAVILVTGGLGYAASLLLLALERRLVSWRS